MAMKIAEALMTIGFVGLILTNAGGFATVVRGAGANYASLVRGLQGR